MILSRLKLQNFMSMRSADIGLDNRGPVLIQGINQDAEDFESNGAGKSTILEGICWVLYGRTIRELTGDDIIHDRIKKNCYGYIDLIDDDGTDYRVARYRNHHENKNSSFVYKSGTKISDKSKKDVTAIVTDLLQMDYNTFVSTILYSSESFKFTVSTDADMKKSFDVMLGFEIINECLKIAKEGRDEKKKQLDKCTSSMASQLDLLEQAKETLEDLKKSEKAAKESAEDKAKEIRTQIAEIKSRVVELNKKRGTHTKDINALNVKVKDIGDSLSALRESDDQLREKEKEAVSIKRDTLAVLDNKKKQERQLEKLQQKLDDTDALIGTTCPVCGSIITKDNFEGVLQEIRDSIKTIGKEIDKLDKDLQKKQEKLASVGSVINSLRKELVGKTKLEKEKEDAQEEIRKLKNLEESRILKIESLNKQSSILESTVESIKKQSENTFKSSIETAKISIQNIKKMSAELLKESRSTREELEEYEFWVEAFGNSGIKSKLLVGTTDFLNAHINFYLQKLASNSLEVKLSTHTKLKDGSIREKFSLEITNKFGGKQFKSNSNGEKQRVSLAVNLALQDLVASRSSKKINVVFFDEVFDTLDSVGVERVVELLHSLDRSSIFVTTHNAELKSYFDNVMTVTKKNGDSYITA